MILLDDHVFHLIYYRLWHGQWGELLPGDSLSCSSDDELSDALEVCSETCRNLLSVDSRLNQIDPSTNIIFVPNAERGYRNKFEILIGGVFQYSIE